MVQHFHPATNTLSRVSILGVVFLVAAAAWAWGLGLRSPYATQEYVVRGQPIPFSHQHHVAGLGIDCRYCHGSVETSSFAGIPSSKTCMTCHSWVWKDAEILAPLRESYAEDRSIEWTRVHDLPDFAYFDHSVHVAAGVGCASCHGRVDEMPLMWRVETLHMEWCLDCHRDPDPHLRDRDEVFDMDPIDLADSLHDRGAALSASDRARLTNCSVCHR